MASGRLILRRGDVVTVATGGGFGGKPRPAVVVQDDAFATLTTTVILMFTTQDGGHPLLRPMFDGTAANGLRETSRLQAHAPLTVRLEDVGKKIGELALAEMAEIDRCLMLLLGFQNGAL